MENMHLLIANQERMKDLKREADQHRMIGEAGKENQQNMLRSARNVLGKSLVAVGQQLLQGVER